MIDEGTTSTVCSYFKDLDKRNKDQSCASLLPSPSIVLIIDWF